MLADGESVARRGGSWLARSFGLGYPDFDEVVRALEERARGEAPPA